MVAVVQLVEHQVVILAVAGSSPVSHPDIGNAVRERAAFLFRRPTNSLSAPSVIP